MFPSPSEIDLKIRSRMENCKQLHMIDKKIPSYPTSNFSFYLEGDPPIQFGHSVGHLYVGSLGGVTGVGGGPPSPCWSWGKLGLNWK